MLPFEAFARLNRTAAAALVLSGIAVIAAIDYISGVEIRTFPLYYLPVALAAWHFGRVAALAAALLSTIGWFFSNQLAGMQFSHAGIWATNAVMQSTSFAVVGLLVARLRDAVRREQQMSRIDPLCQLLNRRAFYDEGHRLVRGCARGRRPATLAYLDLDDFKTVNDSRGHAAGDALLRRIAGAMKASVRASDIVARIGGDEFAVLLFDLTPAEAQRTLERLREAVIAVTRESTCVTVTIGAMGFVDVPAEIDEMVREADAVMYAAKRMGKNQVLFKVNPT